MISNKPNTRTKGKSFEKRAEIFFVQKGCRILERNWQDGHQEIDLIILDQKTIAFVEVKGATSDRFGHPAEKINKKKRSNLIKAAQKYIEKSNFAGHDFRFDLVTIIGPKLEYYKDAFWDEQSDQTP